MTAVVDVVTGAFSYSGAAIARQLQRTRGHRVRTLTGHPHRAPAGNEIDVHPLDFTDPTALARSMNGAQTLYNTYWVRFPHHRCDHQVAVANTLTLFDAAARAGVQRIVHISITHASPTSPYSYFRGKAEVEQGLAALGIPYAIARPATLFGAGGVLINNIAWLLRHLPVFAIGGRGDYPIRGIHVNDLASLCVDLGARSDSVVVDAVGPQTLTFKELVQAVKSAVGSNALIVPVPGALLRVMSRTMGMLLRDKLLTSAEYQAMVDGLATSDAPATGRTVMTDWIAEHGPELGRVYANELNLHYRSPTPQAARGAP
ncbi:MAG: NAD(P)H-binding protein [Actinophytocola sp.]|nr:NAD(P)H-binding protein [Actinophytocola sp.]